MGQETHDMMGWMQWLEDHTHTVPHLQQTLGEVRDSPDLPGPTADIRAIQRYTWETFEQILKKWNAGDRFEFYTMCRFPLLFEHARFERLLDKARKNTDRKKHVTAYFEGAIELTEMMQHECQEHSQTMLQLRLPLPPTSKYDRLREIYGNDRCAKNATEAIDHAVKGRLLAREGTSLLSQWRFFTLPGTDLARNKVTLLLKGAYG